MDKLNNSIYLKKPIFDELKYSQELYSCPKTMAFNNKWGGTVDFPKEKWDSFYHNYLAEGTVNVYFHIYNLDSVFVGEVSSRLLRENVYSLNIKIKYEFRGNNHALDALNIFLEYMFNEHEAIEITDDIASDNIGAYKLLRKVGFIEVSRTQEVIYMKLDKHMYI